MRSLPFQASLPRAPHGPAGALLAVALGALALPGCDKPTSVTPVESISAERVESIEREVRSLRDERDALLHGAAVSSAEGLALASQLRELQNRLSDLEMRPPPVAPGASSDASGSSGGASTSSTPGVPLPPVVGIPIPPDTTTPFSEEQLGAFRRMSDEIDRRKALEQQARRLKDDLSRAGVSLNADQEATLLRIQEAYTEKMRQLYRSGGGGTDADRQAIQAKRDELRTQYANDVRAALPATEADKIIEATSRMGGFRPRAPGSMGPRGANSGG